MAIKGKCSCAKSSENTDNMSSESSCSANSGQLQRYNSPSRLSRMAEKSELQNLNDRLACYMDRARKLEIENNRLKIEICKIKESDDQELCHVKDIYEEKVCCQNHCIDEVMKEKSKLDNEIARLWAENDDIRKELEKAAKDCAQSENRARHTEVNLTDVSQKYNCKCADYQQSSDSINFLQAELERLKKLLEEARRNLENEVLIRVQAENNLNCCREQLERTCQVHDQEMKENVCKRLNEVTEMNSRLTLQYEVKLRKALHDLREEYEAQIRTNRNEIDLIYEVKIKALQKDAEQHAKEVSFMEDELKSARNCVSRLNDHVQELTLEVNQLKNHLRELECKTESEKAILKAKICTLETQLQKCKAEVLVRIKEYQDLMDVKVSLDMEISAYAKLLMGEEKRFEDNNNACDIEDCNECAKKCAAPKCGPCRKHSPCHSPHSHSPHSHSPQKSPPKCQSKCHTKGASKCAPKPAAQCPEICPSKGAQKCPQCPQKCPQKSPQKCPQKSPPKCHSNQNTIMDDILYDMAPINEPASILPVKRYLSSDFIVPNKRQRIPDNNVEDDNKYFVIASANGPIEINEADPDGYFVKLYNKTNNEIDIGGWTIKRLVGKNEMSFTLYPDTIMEGNGSLSVWSTDSCVTHDPPKNFVMNGQKWIIDKRMETILLNRNGVEQASSQRIKRVSSSRSSSCSEGGFGVDISTIDIPEVRH